MNLKTPSKKALAALSAAAFSLLFGYELVRSSSNALFQTFYGTKNLPLMMTLIPVTVAALVYGYQVLLHRMGPRKSLLVTSVASGFVLMGCSWAIQLGFDPARGILYVFREAYIVLLLEQYWSFVDSSLNDEGAKRFNGIFSGTASVGAILGGIFLSQYAEGLGAILMPVIAGVTILLAAYLSDRVYAWTGEPAGELSNDPSIASTGAVTGLAEFRRTPLLGPLLLLVMITQVIPTVLGLAFQEYLQIEVPQVDQQAAFSGRFYAILNGVSFVFQFFATRWVLQKLRISVVHALIPLIHVVTIAVFLLQPSLMSVGVAFLVFKAFDYSIFRAAKEMLYIPLSFEARYRAKQLIDVVGYRVSKGGTSLSILLLQRAGMVLAPVYGWAALAASFAWLATLLPIFQHLKQTEKMPETTPGIS